MGGIYNTITKYNDQHHTILSNVKIIEAINQVMIEAESEANKATVDMFSTQKNKSDHSKYLINKFANLTINDNGDDLINKIANLTINDVRQR